MSNTVKRPWAKASKITRQNKSFLALAFLVRNFLTIQGYLTFSLAPQVLFPNYLDHNIQHNLKTLGLKTHDYNFQ